MPFDIADEVDVDLSAKFERLEGQRIALVVLGAVTEDSNPRTLVTQNLT